MGHFGLGDSAVVGEGHCYGVFVRAGLEGYVIAFAEGFVHEGGHAVKTADGRRGAGVAVAEQRGECLLIGEVDFTLPLKTEMTKVEASEILALQKVELKKHEDKCKKKALLEPCRQAPQGSDSVMDEYY